MLEKCPQCEEETLSKIPWVVNRGNSKTLKCSNCGYEERI